MQERLSWGQFIDDYNLLYIIGLIFTFTSVFMIESTVYAGSFSVVTMIFRFGIIFDIKDAGSRGPLICMCASFLGNVCGSLASAPIANRWGRRIAVLLGCAILIVGASMVTAT
jgi:MFS family permease